MGPFFSSFLERPPSYPPPPIHALQLRLLLQDAENFEFEGKRSTVEFILTVPYENVLSASPQ